MCAQIRRLPKLQMRHYGGYAVGDAGAAPTAGCTARNWSAKFAVVLRVPGVRSHAQGVAVAIQKSDSGSSLRNGEVPPSEMKEAPTQPLTKRAGARHSARSCCA